MEADPTLVVREAVQETPDLKAIREEPEIVADHRLRIFLLNHFQSTAHPEFARKAFKKYRIHKPNVCMTDDCEILATAMTNYHNYHKAP